MKNFFRKQLKTLAVCVCIFFIGTKLHFAALLYFLMACAVVGLLIRIIKFWPRNDWGKLYVQFMLLLITYAAIEVTFDQNSKERRCIAETIAQKLMQYQSTHGQYPAQLKDIGQKSNGETYRIKYSFLLQKGGPLLYYADTNPAMGNDYIYHFQKKAWIDTSRY